MGLLGAAVEPGEDFDEWFLSRLPRVIRLAHRITGNQTLAEDVAAEAFARAFARWRRVGTLAYRDAWVLRVASNVAIDAMRQRPVPHEFAELGPIDGADAAALRATLVSALTMLSKGEREAVVLRYLADLSEDDVAAALRVKPGTVKSDLHRGVASLREQLGRELEQIG